jgi:hypothetical protein
MNTLNYRVSHFEWMISLAQRKSGGAFSMKGSTGSSMVHPTFDGMCSRWRA